MTNTVNRDEILIGYDTDDFAIEFSDGPEVSDTPEGPIEPEGISRIEQKLDNLQSRLEGVTPEYVRDIETLEKLILPMLVKLSKGEQEYIKWPNRSVQVTAQIDKILNITRKYYNGDNPASNS